MADRKLVSWRIENIEPEQMEPVNKWLDAQPNIQVALTNIAMHMIAHFGYTNIMNYDIQRALYQGFGTTPVHTLPSDETKIVEEKPKVVEEKTPSVATVAPKPVVQPKVVEEPPKQSNDDSDDLYKDLDL